MATPLISAPSSQRHLASGAWYDNIHAREDLTSEGEFEYDEDMGELSDSHSSYNSASRPSTPSHTAAPRVRTRSSRSPSAESGPFTIAHKAVQLLGLVPGTLPHAIAALESARDEVRRTSETHAVAPCVPINTSEPISSSPNGMRGRIDRAKKALSVTFPNGSKVPEVVIGAGGREEEMKRERRRRAADGVLYWQKEVARLEKVEMETIKGKPSNRKRR